MRKKYKQDFIHAGKLCSSVRAFGKSLIKRGASYNGVLLQINQKIVELGAKPAFPPQIALDDVAAHFLPDPGVDIIFKEQLVKLDIGVCYNGAIGDCAVTVDLSGKYQHIIEAAEAALLAAENSIHVGQKVSDIGRIIEETIISFGLKPVRNLAGHGLGFNQVHTLPQIPNYNDGSTAIIKPGMTFAIEPFATNGKGMIYEKGHPTIFSYTGKRTAISDTALYLLNKIKAFEGLPFALHDLITEQLSLAKIQPLIEELVKARLIHGYPPLVEMEGGMVAQAENSILVDDSGKVFVTTR